MLVTFLLPQFHYKNMITSAVTKYSPAPPAAKFSSRENRRSIIAQVLAWPTLARIPSPTSAVRAFPALKLLALRVRGEKQFLHPRRIRPEGKPLLRPTGQYLAGSE
jgi:hypothetical protein